MNSYDVIVLGSGGVGSAAAFHLARRGARVLGLDRFPGGHPNGSSHGETRIIRKAYFEHADYVPLLHRAYELWHELEDRTGERLYREVGLVEAGPPDGFVVPSILEAARLHDLAVEEVSHADFKNHYPFNLPAGDVAVFEKDAGLLLVEPCVLAHLQQAAACGAELRTGEAVVQWQASDARVLVRTESETYHAASLVITAGPWAPSFLADLGIVFEVRRKHLHWYDCADSRYLADNGCPAFFFETPAGYQYGFPQINERGVKVADHTGGSAIENPLNDDKTIEPEDRRRVDAFVASYLSGVSAQHRRHEVCYYTMSPDEHFIVDQHPEHSNVAFAAGLSGHGFKFTCLLGEVLADLVLARSTEHPIEFLRSSRFGG